MYAFPHTAKPASVEQLQNIILDPLSLFLPDVLVVRGRGRGLDLTECFIALILG